MEIWRFSTSRFDVVYTQEIEYEDTTADICDDENRAEIRRRLDTGDLQEFCAKVAVLFDGEEVAASYLGGCIYEDGEAFIDHRGISKPAMQERARRDLAKAKDDFAQEIATARRLKAKGYRKGYWFPRVANAHKDAKEARAAYVHTMRAAGHVGSYFSQMVREAIQEARQEVAKRQANPVTLRHA